MPGGHPDDHGIPEPLTGPERVRAAIARDRGHYAPGRPVQLCGPDPDKGVLYVPRELLPDDQRDADAVLSHMIRELACPVHAVYRADWSPPVRPLPWPRRLGNRLVAPLARVLGF